jgi:hypothetical protein
MAKAKSQGRNDDRPNGKAWKKVKKTPKRIGKTIGGYSPAKLKIRESKRTPANAAKARELADKLAKAELTK